jgi:homoserine dehydrogenase
MVTHEAPELAITDTLALLAGSDSLLGDPMVMHILAD